MNIKYIYDFLKLNKHSMARFYPNITVLYIGNETLIQFEKTEFYCDLIGASELTYENGIFTLKIYTKK